MSVGNPQAIGPVPAQPPKYGLLVATDTPIGDALIAGGPEQSSPAEWAQGVKWAPEQFHGGGIVGLDCMGRTPDELQFGDNAVINTADPFVVYASDQCSTFGFEGRDPWGRARRQLEATQSFHIAREFQLGTLRDADGLANPALVDALEISPSPATPLNALAELEGAIADRFAGARAMIHCTPQTLTLLMGAGPCIVPAGQKWLTALGSIVVADAGYQAVDGTEWMYATGLVRVRLGAVITIPNSADERSAWTDRATNDTKVVAQRLALVQVDATETGEVGPPDEDADAMFKVEVDVEPWTAAS